MEITIKIKYRKYEDEWEEVELKANSILEAHAVINDFELHLQDFVVKQV